MSSERPISRFAIVIIALFGLFYAYDVWEAFGSLLQAPAAYRAAGREVPWALLIAGVAAPIVFYVVALLVGRRQRMLACAIILAVGLALAAAVSLSIIGSAQLL